MKYILLFLTLSLSTQAQWVDFGNKSTGDNIILNDFTQNFGYLKEKVDSKVVIRVGRNSNAGSQTVAANSSEVMEWNQILEDSHNAIYNTGDDSSHPGFGLGYGIRIPKTGRYDLDSLMTAEQSSTGSERLYCYFKVNTTTIVYKRDTLNASGHGDVKCSILGYPLNEGDVVTLTFAHNYGAGVGISKGIQSNYITILER